MLSSESTSHLTAGVGQSLLQIVCSRGLPHCLVAMVHHHGAWCFLHVLSLPPSQPCEVVSLILILQVKTWNQAEDLDLNLRSVLLTPNPGLFLPCHVAVSPNSLWRPLHTMSTNLLFTLFFPPAVLTYNWHVTLCKFKMYYVLIRWTYTLQKWHQLHHIT